VAACCYAFKRDLLSRFPADVVADDVHAVALANTLGYHTIYSHKAKVEELRTPTTLPEFFRHKYRKGNAVLREMLRFCYRVPDMNGRWKSILTTCLAQQLILPWGVAAWVALAATLINFGQVDVVGLALVFLLVAVLATRKAVHSIELPTPPERFSPVTVVLACVYMLGILCATIISYPIFRQSSSYARLRGAVGWPTPSEWPTASGWPTSTGWPTSSKVGDSNRRVGPAPHVQPPNPTPPTPPQQPAIAGGHPLAGVTN